MDPKNLAGSLKAAILIQAMEKEASQIIVNSLNDTERKLIQGHLSQMGTISPQLVEKIAKEFTEAKKFTKLEQLKGSQKSKNGSMLENEQDIDKKSIDTKSKSSNLNAIQSMEPDQLVKMIKDEHPQTIAIIIAHLKSEVASEVLSKLPDESKIDIAFRIANLDNVISAMVEEIDKVFEDILNNEQTSVTHKTGGIEHLAEILNQADGMTAEFILNEIEESNPELAAQIKQMMFVFEDLIMVDDRGLQQVLRRLEMKELALALKGASEDVKEKIFRNMSSRASEMLQEEIEDIGAVRMKDVEDSQQNITKIIQEMEAKGEIIITGRRGEEFIA